MLNAVRVAAQQRECSEPGLFVFHFLDNPRNEFEEEGVHCQSCGTGMAIEPRRRVGDPSAVDVDQHDFTQCPCRSWCPARVEAKGRMTNISTK